MIKNNYFIIIFILSVLLNNNFSYGQKLVNISPKDTRYSVYHNSNECLFGPFYFLCDQFPCDFTTLEPSALVLGEIVNSNSTNTLYRFSISNFNTPGIQTVKFNDNVLFTLDCKAFDISQIRLEKVSDYYQTPNVNIFLSFSIVYRVTGTNIDPSIVDTYNWINWSSFQCELIKCTVIPIVGGYLIFQFDLSTNFKNLIDVPIEFTFESTTFKIEPILKSGYFMNISNINTYPSLQALSDYQTQGVGEGAVLEFTTNYTVYNSPMFLIENNLYSGAFQYYPIKGNHQETTFLSSMVFPIKEYILSTQEDSKYITSISLSVSIKDYSIGSVGTSMKIIESAGLEKPMVSLTFSLNSAYKFTTINSNVILGGRNNKRNLKFPFGFINNNQDPDSGIKTLSYKVDHIIRDTNINNYIRFSLSFPREDSIQTADFPTTNQYNISKIAQLKKVEFNYLFDDLYLMKVYPTFGYSFGGIIINSKSIGGITLNSQFFGIESKDNSNLEVYEVLVQSSTVSSIILLDCYYYSIEYFDNYELVGTNSITEFLKFPKKLDYSFDPYSIQNVSFLYNTINVTNERQFNVIYFNFSNEVPRDTPVMLINRDITLYSNLEEPESIESRIFYGSYNYLKQLFQIEFYVESNTQDGDFPMLLIVDGIMIHSNTFTEKLKVTSLSMDLQGPLITDVKKSNGVTISDYQLQKTGDIIWTMTIEDTINGFSHGYVVVRGSVDQSIYNFTITPSNATTGNISIGVYRFKIQAYYPCVSQDFVISEVVLYDRMDRMSIYSTVLKNYAYSGVMNPFLTLLNDPTIYSISLTCTVPDPVAAEDTSPPDLISFASSVNSIDNLALQNITFTFTAQDLESGIKIGQQNPIVYLSSSNNNILECISNITSIDKGTLIYGNKVTYSCSIQIPLGFGYIDGISVSVYGFINNNGFFIGYSTRDLSEISPSYFISTSFGSKSIFSNHFRITEKGGDLWIIGRGFTNSINPVTVEYYDGSKQSIIVDNIYYTVLRVPGIRPTNKPFKVYSPTTNTLTVSPTIFNYPDSYISSSSSSSSDTPLPTNAPKSCPGKPVCGGPSNGKCITNQGCVCYSPWIGLDCSSQIIVIDPPKANETSPSTNITLPTKDNNNNSTVIYKSLITLGSIREIDILGNIAYNKTFDIWQVRQLQSDNTTFIYNTTLQINKNNQITLTNVTVTLQWFINETTINFANEELTMNPSTMKYTIEINNYPFNSDLNQLQLIMSASIESDTNENICSAREFGETTTGDNSNYLKIQVDNHSLYGRFIRRGIIDSKIAAISNVLLDKDMNSITTTKQLQSFIGIQIPHFKNNIILDPDFSILIDSNKASSKSNSICSNKSKLTGAKIAGIVIGCTAFVAVIIIAISYHIIKKKKDAKFISNVNQKMKNMNNDKL